jgi:hypothetical protein
MKVALILTFLLVGQQVVAFQFPDGVYEGSITCSNRSGDSMTLRTDFELAGETQTFTFHIPDDGSTPAHTETASLRMVATGNNYYQVIVDGHIVGEGYCIADACHARTYVEGVPAESTSWLQPNGDIVALSSMGSGSDKLICEEKYVKVP